MKKMMVYWKKKPKISEKDVVLKFSDPNFGIKKNWGFE